MNRSSGAGTARPRPRITTNRDCGSSAATSMSAGRGTCSSSNRRAPSSCVSCWPTRPAPATSSSSSPGTTSPRWSPAARATASPRHPPEWQRLADAGDPAHGGSFVKALKTVAVALGITLGAILVIPLIVLAGLFVWLKLTEEDDEETLELDQDR